MKKKISIILPFWNEEAFIMECLESFSAQQVDDCETELLAINDGSTDSSPKIVSDYASKDDRVILVNNKGKGIIDALQTGSAHSSGNFISRMDGDDIMPPNKLAHLYSQLSAGAQVATGKVKYFATGKNLGDGFKKYEAWLNGLVDSDAFFNQIFRECPIASPNWMMWRADFDSIGGFGHNYPEDYDLVFRMKAGGLSAKGSPEITHLWRDHGSRASRNDSNYTDNSFLELKCAYFLDEASLSSRPCVLIGAGRRGKKIAQILDQSVDSWITNNSKKTGHKIHGIVLSKFENHKFSSDNLYVSSLSSPDDRLKMESTFRRAGLKEGTDYFHFC